MSDVTSDANKSGLSHVASDANKSGLSHVTSDANKSGISNVTSDASEPCLEFQRLAAALAPVEDVEGPAGGHVVGGGVGQGASPVTLVVGDVRLPSPAHQALELEQAVLRPRAVHVHVQQPVVGPVAERGQARGHGHQW